MGWTPFLKGLILGFSIAAPVGPIAILCVQRTLARGRWAGFVSGLGAATADALYGLVAVLGVGFLTEALLGRQAWMRLLGGLFLVALGARLFFQAPPDQTGTREPDKSAGYLVMYSTTFLLTLSNPMTVIAFSAVFTGLGAVGGSVPVLIGGVFSGSALWWAVLAVGAGYLRRLISPAAMGLINRLAGTAIVGFGIVVTGAGIMALLN